MPRNIPRRKEDIGLSPYEMVFRGQKKIDEATMFVIDFNTTNVKEMEINEVEELETFKKSHTTTWLNVNGLDNVPMMEKLRALFEIDSNIMSDIMNPMIRSKVQEFDHGLFVTLKMLQINEKNKLAVENLSLLIMDNFVISFQEGGGDVSIPFGNAYANTKQKSEPVGPITSPLPCWMW